MMLYHSLGHVLLCAPLDWAGQLVYEIRGRRAHIDERDAVVALAVRAGVELGAAVAAVALAANDAGRAPCLADVGAAPTSDDPQLRREIIEIMPDLVRALG